MATPRLLSGSLEQKPLWKFGRCPGEDSVCFLLRSQLLDVTHHRDGNSVASSLGFGYRVSALLWADLSLPSSILWNRKLRLTERGQLPAQGLFFFSWPGVFFFFFSWIPTSSTWPWEVQLRCLLSCDGP